MEYSFYKNFLMIVSFYYCIRGEAAKGFEMGLAGGAEQSTAK